MKTFAHICMFVCIITSFLYIFGNVVLRYKFQEFYKTVNEIKWDYKDFYSGDLPFYMKRWFIVITHIGSVFIYTVIAYLAKPSAALLTFYVLALIGQYTFSLNRIKELWNAQ